ncbi:unnamed protein product [Periconia digitata]|uniref:Uncharacterized protein n=1 Tax=Periconia digitata TaxID=1303443 RepID=A0A9W4UM55_9PLEO|nr:unnamed protein product [Periconia digitata]
MSKWRLKGYVPDSDEEDENLEITSSYPNRDESQVASLKHINGAASPPIRDSTDQKKDGNLEIISQKEDGADNTVTWSQQASPTPSFAPVVPAISTTVPTTASTYTSPPQRVSVSERDRTESPDILQACLVPNVPLQTKPVPSQEVAVDTIAAPSAPLNRNASTVNANLAAFGLDNGLFSSSDDDLSDPPSDMESEGMVEKTVFASPKQNQRVQVVIPTFAGASPEIPQAPPNRSLRARRPDQLHPYLVEDQRWRQKLEESGYKNIPRYRSPVRQPVNRDADTQDTEFEPDNEEESIDPSMGLASSPVITERATDDLRTSTQRRPSLASAQDSAPRPPKKRRKLQRHTSGRLAQHPQPSLPDPWALPPSPPHAADSPANQTMPGLTVPTTNSPVIDLPTPSHSSSLQGHDDSDNDVVQPLRRLTQRRRSPITVSSDNSSTRNSSDEAEQSDSEIRQMSKKIRGVLPASWLRIDAQKKKPVSSLSRELFNDARSPEKSGPQRGVAQKVIRSKGLIQRSPAQTIQHRIPDVVSDESDDDGVEIPIRFSIEAQQDAQAATNLAARLDRQYTGDESDMEDDRLDLFPLGGSSRKRKQQTKVTDAFQKFKKPKLSRNNAKGSTVPTARTLGKL